MKKILLLLCFVAESLVCSLAQNANARYVVCYHKSHSLFLQGGAMNVVDMNLEWPELLAGSVVDSLQFWLEQNIFQNTSASWRDAQKHFFAGMGSPVKDTLATVPDDDKFCYISCNLKEMGLWKGRFASFLLDVRYAPEAKSQFKAKHTTKLVTYDMINNQFVDQKQILRLNKIINDDASSFQFSKLLFAHLTDSVSFVPSHIRLAEDVGIGNGHLIVPFTVYEDNDDVSVNLVSYIPQEELSEFLAKDFQRRLKCEPVGAPHDSPYSYLDEEDVYDVVDEQPRLAISPLPVYMASHLCVPSLVKYERMENSKSLATFVVEKDGSIEDVRIIRPSTPSLDRAFVDVLRLMPKWEPGRLNGHVVRTRVYVPLNVKMQ